VGGGLRIAPANNALPVFFHAEVRGSFHRHVSPRPSFGGLAAGGVLAGEFPRVLFPPLWCFPPRCAGAVPPRGLLTRSVASAFMGPPPLPSGVGTPDLGWQQGGRRGRAAAARISTTPPETLAGAQASPRHMMMVGRSARRGDGQGGAGARRCALPARVWLTAARCGLRVWRQDHRDSIVGRPEGAQPPNTAGGNTTRGETAHGETHPPTHTPPRVLQKRAAAKRGGGERSSDSRVNKHRRSVVRRGNTRSTPHCKLM